MSQNKIFKLLCVGDPGIGKTCLAYRYVAGTFKDITQSTIITSFLQKRIGDVRVDWYDSAGQETYRSLTIQFFRGANAAIVVFAGQNFESSFNNAVQWCRDVRERTTGTEVKMIMVENKVDLARETNEQVVNSFCEENDVRYFKVSAKTGEGLDDLFGYLAKVVQEHDYIAPSIPAIQVDVPREKEGCC